MRSIFFSYSHADEALRDQLEEQLAILKRQQVISTWHDRRILAGSEFDPSIDANLQAADIILLLVSPAFLASDYCYEREMTLAMQRHERGEARVIPVILRPCDWHDAPFGKLLAAPRDGKAITQWPDRDEAFLQVAQAIKAAAKDTGASPVRSARSDAPPIAPPAAAPSSFSSGPRSSNLRLAKEFSERDKDRFKLETFEFIARFFENSLGELEARNQGIEGAYRRIDANRFSAVIYRAGKSLARCTVFVGGQFFANGIAYSSSETSDSNSFNECLTVEADDQMLYLRGMGMAHYGGNRDSKLSQEGAAELFWAMLVEPLQQR
ncbi:toll/interleukin-1 receptor domain-containing protein [Sphingobium lactosutens]|uniref:TIR domain-containing protein n=1 Tax=Sphingobium lactosutens DS20 TaxID=1331060 RepID=T0IYH9_9SPHN|nr:TIR domain-containing protein [Sphingobium lactosutens]EQB16930.1 hypothetical protein RLDS_05710 [Sphingobium lactosutens DS20]